jgi:hypothetical protein
MSEITNIIYDYPNGDKYMGEWLDGKKHGKGVLISKTQYFEGYFINDIKHGHGGCRFFESGHEYSGYWENGEPYAHGKYTKGDISFNGYYVDDSINIKPYDYSLGFIHIPKTGGSDLTNSFIKILSHHLKFIIKEPNGHLTNGFDYENDNIESFTIMREPIDRFISGFKYYYHTMNNTKYSDINLFLKSYINREEDLEQIIVFKKQKKWLDCSNIFIIKYDTSNTYTNVGLFLKNEVGIDFQYDFTGYSKINVSKSENLNCILEEKSIDVLRNIYADDIKIYSRFNNIDLPYFRLE